MNNKYKATEKFWDNVFEQKEITNPEVPISNKQLEKSLEWISNDNKTIDKTQLNNTSIYIKILF